MTLETARVSAVLPASADAIYAAWLDSEGHSRMTGGKAEVHGVVGGEFSAWDGYVHGKTLALEPGRRIVQSWRSTDFPLGHGDSRLEVHLLEVDGGTETTIIHTEIPEGQAAQYTEGWHSHYLTPMRKYFSKSAPRAKAKKKSASKAAPSRRKAAPKKVSSKKPSARTAGPKKAAKKAAARKK